MNIRDVVSGLFWLAIAFFVCFKSFQMEIGTFQSPGSGFLPFWSGVILGILTIFLIITSVLKKQGKVSIARLWSGTQWTKVILALTSLFIYTILLPKLGYLIATVALVIILFNLMGRPKLWVQVVSAMGIVFASYIIFYVWLKVQLPTGIFGF